MKKFIVLVMVTLFGLMAVAAFAMLNPVTSVNYTCLFPINVGILPAVGTSTNPGASAYDSSVSKSSGFLCLCYRPLPIPGLPFGMTKPTHIIESTTTQFAFPSLGIFMGNPARLGGSDSATRPNRTAFAHTHIHKFNILKLLDIFTDVLCGMVDSNPFDILYMSEIDVVANSSGMSILLFPESVLVSNPVVGISCGADALAAGAGVSIDAMYWCAGGHSIYPVSNFTPQAAGFEDSSSIMLAKTMYRMNRTSMGKSFGLTAGPLAVAASCSTTTAPSPNVIKNQFKFQPAMPFVGNCEKMGTPSIKWNTPKRSLPSGDTVGILWTREDCCAL